MSELQEQSIRQHCKTLRMPTIGGQFARLADAATREGQSHVGYLDALLTAEMEERESRAITRLLHEAKLPRMKTLDAFEFDRSGVSAGQLRTLAEGDYVTRAEPILLVGEAGTGKTHLATGLCVAACRQRRRVRFTTATGLINELAEAAHANQLSRALARWERLDLICIDELGYVPLAETACELMFQVIAIRSTKGEDESRTRRICSGHSAAPRTVRAGRPSGAAQTASWRSPPDRRGQRRLASVDRRAKHGACGCPIVDA
jgi:DNA replication protein DnaC